MLRIPLEAFIGVRNKEIKKEHFLSAEKMFILFVRKGITASWSWHGCLCLVEYFVNLGVLQRWEKNRQRELEKRDKNARMRGQQLDRQRKIKSHKTLEISGFLTIFA
jgi:hypothetical protein